MDPLEKQLSETPPIEAALPTPTPESDMAQSHQTYDSGHRGHIAPVRTFSSDLANAIREKGGSVVRIAIAEEEKHRKEQENVSIKSKKNIVMIVASIILMIGAIAVVVWGYQQKQAASVVTPVVNVLPPSILSVEDSATIDTTAMQVADVVSAVRSRVATATVRAGTMQNLLLSQKVSGIASPISISQFLSVLGAHAPADFVRALSKDFMLGLYSYNGQNNLFLIVHGTAHDFVLAGIINWESNLMSDLGPLFGFDPTDPAAAKLLKVPFTDTIIENREARAILGANNKPVLFYSFLDPNTIIITTDPKTLTEAILRF